MRSLALSQNQLGVLPESIGGLKSLTCFGSLSQAMSTSLFVLHQPEAPLLEQQPAAELARQLGRLEEFEVPHLRGQCSGLFGVQGSQPESP